MDTLKKPNIITLYTLGGWSQYGRNSTLLIYNNEGLILDCGVNVAALINDQKSEMYPNFRPSLLKKIKLKGVLLSHAHLDHIGAIPILNKIIDTVYYGSKFTNELCKQLKYNVHFEDLEPDTDFELGPFKIRAIEVQHSIPGALFYRIQVENTNLCYASDFKLDGRPVLGQPTNLESLKEKLGHIDYLMFDTTRAYEKINRTSTESLIREQIIEELYHTPYEYNNVFYACFASQISRISSLIEVGISKGYKVYVLGKTFQYYLNASRNTEIYNAPPEVKMISKNYDKFFTELNKTSKNLCIVSGVNGEPNAVLTRLVDAKFGYLNIAKDIVIFGGGQIPGSEHSRRILCNKLNIFNTNVIQIHASGHASLKDIIRFINYIKPGNLLPTHSNFSSLGVLLDALKVHGYSYTGYKNKVYVLGMNHKFTIDLSKLR
jgi:ribonuclease J